MTIDNCITYWALKLKEPLKMTVKDKLCENIILTDTRRWFEARFDDSFKDDLKKIDDFCYYVLDNYEPTGTNPYPSTGSLTRLYNNFKSSIKPFSQVEHKPLTIEDKRKAKTDMVGVKKKCPEEYLNIDIKIVEANSKKMSKLELLRKYGINLCGELWSEGLYSRHGYFKSREKEQDKNLRRMF